MSFAELVAARRTHKAFGPEPVARETLIELFELALLAPNHHLTQPWRFRVLGPETLARLKDAAGPSEALKLERAPTLVLASAALSGELLQDEEDVCATAAAITLVLLGATERGLASYWRTPGILRTERGREAVGLPHGERVLGLIHLGPPEREPSPRERGPVGDYVEFLP
ncbi:MAG TPA: nitroreductase family protein [Gaiellaceae bacterium]|nr:nitroreductase family protein [Gaiellaceae bacterium]